MKQSTVVLRNFHRWRKRHPFASPVIGLQAYFVERATIMKLDPVNRFPLASDTALLEKMLADEMRAGS